MNSHIPNKNSIREAIPNNNATNKRISARSHFFRFLSNSKYSEKKLIAAANIPSVIPTPKYLIAQFMEITTSGHINCSERLPKKVSSATAAPALIIIAAFSVNTPKSIDFLNRSSMLISSFNLG